MKCNSGIFTYSLLLIPGPYSIWSLCLTSVWPLYDLFRSAVDQRWLHDEVPVAWSVLSQREEDQIQRQMEGALPSFQTEWKTREREILPLRFPQSWYCIVLLDCVCKAISLSLSLTLHSHFLCLLPISWLFSLCLSRYFFSLNFSLPSLSLFFSLSVTLSLSFFLCLSLTFFSCFSIYINIYISLQDIIYAYSIFCYLKEIAKIKLSRNYWIYSIKSVFFRHGRYGKRSGLLWRVQWPSVR